MAADFGTDISTFPDLDLTFTIISGPRVLGQALARRLSTPRGKFKWAPNYGLDLRAMLGAKLDVATLNRWRSNIVAEVEKDERVISALVDIHASAQSGLISIGITITVITSDGPFRFTLAVDQLSVQLLEAAAA